jgi:hypothetical protein
VAKRNAFSKINPSAAVIIYNYRDRLGTTDLNTPDPHEVEQVIVNTASLKSISTNKSKGSPAGTFEMQLAPTKNWTTAITPGSWCVILMGRTPIQPNETKYNNAKVDKRHFKMLGRIESVRCATAVDPLTGALSTTYIVTGTDWGSIFNSVLYIDPAARTVENSAIGAANALFYDNLVTTDAKTNKEVKLYDSMTAVRALVSFWGASDPYSDMLKDTSDGKLLSKTVNRFAIPQELVNYMGFTDKAGKPNKQIASILRTRGNVLTGYDSYSAEDDKTDPERTDGVGFIEPRSIYEMNTLWQLMLDNSNKALNELITDIRWEGDQPHLTIYKRVKPFKIRSYEEIISDNTEVTDGSAPTLATEFVQKQCSDFKNIRRHKIPEGDILAVNAGTNWRDRFNFVEVRLDKQIVPAFQNKDMISLGAKLDSQFYDHKSIQRDGLLPMVMPVRHIPSPANGVEEYSIEKIFAYKYLGKEWYFDTHKMLNGVITMVGQDNYIQVGDNIIFKAGALSSNYNTSYDSVVNPDDVWITAHVESIAHNARVAENGARSFITEIQFVRGIVTNENAERLYPTAEMTLDQDAAKMSDSEKANSDRVAGTSSGKSGRQDPDRGDILGHKGVA